MNQEQTQEVSHPKELCRCPLRPCYSLGSLASGRTHEDALVKQWTAEHGSHSYAKARDELAAHLHRAETHGGRGAAVLDMVHDVLGLERAAKG